MTRKEGKKRGIRDYISGFVRLKVTRFERVTFFRPFVLNVAKISNFARLYYLRKLPEGVRSARTFADPCRISVHQDAAAIVSNAKKGWLRFR